MPRIANDTDAMIADITRRLERLVEVARKEGRNSALDEVRALVGGKLPRAGRKPAKAAKKAAKPTRRRKKRKNPWDAYTPEQREARVAKMLAGRGLKPKAKPKSARKPARATKST
jgi:predicted secreted Zn-dependent protease